MTEHPTRPTVVRIAGLVAGLTLAVLAAGCQSGNATTGHHPTSSVRATGVVPPAPPATVDATPETGTRLGSAAPALDTLAGLPVRVEDTGAHYNRTEWGGWSTQDGCDTRESVLQGQGSEVSTGRGCRVIAGRWVSPYDGLRLRVPAEVQIDHRVSVKEAVRSGARGWDRAQRQRFYNDPANLVAVSAHANTSKGDRDPGTWRPSNRDTWCGYATAYITTKTTYHLAVDQREHDALASMLRTCPAADTSERK
jgi:hypothetical protein